MTVWASPTCINILPVSTTPPKKKKDIMELTHNLHTAGRVAGLGFSCCLISLYDLTVLIPPSSMIRWPHLAYKLPHSFLFIANSLMILFPVSFGGFFLSL